MRERAGNSSPKFDNVHEILTLLLVIGPRQVEGLGGRLRGGGHHRPRRGPEEVRRARRGAQGQVRIRPQQDSRVNCSLQTLAKERNHGGFLHELRRNVAARESTCGIECH